MSGSATDAIYVYCVVKDATAIGKAPKGLAGTKRLRAVDAGDGWSVIVADAPLTRYSGAVIDEQLKDLDWVGARAGEHEAVVEHAIDLGTVVPMKLFTLFSSEERAVAHVKKTKRSLETVAKRIGGCEEWGLRILLDEKRARARAAAPVKSKSGTGFLQRKKEIEDQRKRSGELGVTEARALFDALAPIAKKALQRPAPRELAARVFLDAAFLVPKREVAKLKKAVGKAAPALVEEGFDITLSGPWPAYSFITGK